MSSTNKQQGSIIAIITMMFLYAMISFVTNLAAPIGTVWKGAFEGGNNVLGMLGNFMNFFAYLFMGIPAGKLLSRIGYKKTAFVGIALGFFGVLVQFLSGKFGADSLTTGFVVYLTGAFISGLCVCILNVVVNPMLNLLGGGGNRGNQLNMIGGTLNSLSGTLTPLFVGALIGTVTKTTSMTDVNPVLFIAMGVFVAAFIILIFIPIHDPEMGKTSANTVFEHSPWSFRHFVFGVIGIFLYVGVEVGIPGTLIYYLSDTTGAGGLKPDYFATATAIAGAVAATYWLLMLVGRFIGSFIANKISSKTMLSFASALGVIFIIIAMTLGKSTYVQMPAFTGKAFEMVNVPIAALFFVLCGLCTSVMWTSVFNLATEGLGKYTAAGSGIFMMMVVGGGIMPLIQSAIANSSYLLSYIVPALSLAYLLFYGLVGSKNVNKDIPVQ
jgi:FHS family L-fucose permease-like MFS transporter